jgi:hypothetical protein
MERVERIAGRLGRRPARLRFSIEHPLDSPVKFAAAEGEVKSGPGCAVIRLEGPHMFLLVGRQDVVNGVLHSPLLAGRQAGEVGDAGQGDRGLHLITSYQRPGSADTLPAATAGAAFARPLT